MIGSLHHIGLRLVMAVAIVAAAAGFCSCGGDGEPAPQPAESGDWTVQVTANQGLRIDSVALYLLNADYDQLQQVPRDTTAGHGAGWTFSGQMSEPQIAVLRVAGVKAPLCFIVEPCLTTISLGKTGTVVWGGKLNHYYMSQAALVDSMQRLLRGVRRSYNLALADTTLTQKKEQQLLGQNKRVSEQRQQLLLRVMRRSDLVGRLMRDQYFQELDTVHMRQL